MFPEKFLISDAVSFSLEASSLLFWCKKLLLLKPNMWISLWKEMSWNTLLLPCVRKWGSWLHLVLSEVMVRSHHLRVLGCWRGAWSWGVCSRQGRGYSDLSGLLGNMRMLTMGPVGHAHPCPTSGCQARYHWTVSQTLPNALPAS